jgi:hypothetical protein
LEALSAFVAATSFDAFEAGSELRLAVAGDAEAPAGAGWLELLLLPAFTMALIRSSLTPASFSATNPSVEVSNLVFDCLIFAMIMSSEIFALTSRITSRLVMAELATAPVLLAPVLGATFFCGADCWEVLLGGEL